MALGPVDGALNERDVRLLRLSKVERPITRRRRWTPVGALYRRVAVTPRVPSNAGSRTQVTAPARLTSP